VRVWVLEVVMTKAKLIQLCVSQGVMLLDDGGGALRADAPVGFVLGGSFAHSADAYLDPMTRSEAYDFLAEAIGTELVKCENPDCDACVHEPMTFAQVQQLYRGERLA